MESSSFSTPRKPWGLYIARVWFIIWSFSASALFFSPITKTLANGSRVLLDKYSLYATLGSIVCAVGSFFLGSWFHRAISANKTAISRIVSYTVLIIMMLIINYSMEILGHRIALDMIPRSNNGRQRPAFKSVDEELAYLNANHPSHQTQQKPAFNNEDEALAYLNANQQPAGTAQQSPSAAKESSRNPDRDAYLQQLDALISDGTPALRLQTVKDPAFVTFLSMNDQRTGRPIRDIAEEADRKHDAVLMSEVYKSFLTWKKTRPPFVDPYAINR